MSEFSISSPDFEEGGEIPKNLAISMETNNQILDSDIFLMKLKH